MTFRSTTVDLAFFIYLQRTNWLVSLCYIALFGCDKKKCEHFGLLTDARNDLEFRDVNNVEVKAALVY